MKHLTRYFLLGLTTVIFFSCASQGGLSVGADERIDNDIADYQTFNWVSDEGLMPSTQVFLGRQSALVFHQESTRSKLKDAVETQLEAKGFEKDTSNPDMLVNYTILEEADQLRTYTRGGHSYLWEGPVEQDVEMVNVEPGTVLVNFINADTGIQVWQGFASGALKKSDIKNDQVLKAKIQAIFDRFDFSGFTVSSERASR